MFHLKRQSELHNFLRIFIFCNTECLCKTGRWDVTREGQINKLLSYYTFVYSTYINASAPKGRVCSNNTFDGSNGAWVSRVAQEQSCVHTWGMAVPHCITLRTSQRLIDAAQHSQTRRQCATSTPVLCPPGILNWEAVWKSAWVEK